MRKIVSATGGFSRRRRWDDWLNGSSDDGNGEIALGNSKAIPIRISGRT
jgi:hypothetical protein